MYQSIDYNELGGLPLTQEIMDFMQNSYNEVFESITEVIGTYAIISGVNLSAGNYSAGWLSIDGEIVPFEAAPASQGTKISVVSATTSLEFANGDIKPVIITRRAILGATGVDLSSFTRITLQTLKTEVDAAQNTANTAQSTANAALAASGALPSGAIIIWSGSIASIPAGWVLCNGLNGTPSLTNRFIVGAGVSYGVGNIGGSDTVTLTTAQMPFHNHTLTTAGSHTHTLPSSQKFAAWINNEADAGSGSSGNEVSGTAYTFTASSGDHTHSVGFSGSGAGHENRPPYYALAYIMKL